MSSNTFPSLDTQASDCVFIRWTCPGLSYSQSCLGGELGERVWRGEEEEGFNFLSGMTFLLRSEVRFVCVCGSGEKKAVQRERATVE